MSLLTSKRRARRSDISGVRADQGALNGDGPLPILGDPDPRTSEALVPEEVPRPPYCRQCDACVPVAATLSTHPTSGGLVTYFRCEEGHANVYFSGRCPEWDLVVDFVRSSQRLA